jgi:hypothetical protein
MTFGLKLTEQHVLCRPGGTDNVTVGNEVALCANFVNERAVMGLAALDIFQVITVRSEK